MPSSLICVISALCMGKKSYCDQMYANELLPRYHGQGDLKVPFQIMQSSVLHHLEQNGVQGMRETVGQVQNFSNQIF